MKALSMVLVFGGYMLIYAAVANQGKFATEPWAGLFADAYTGPASTVSQSTSTSSSSDTTLQVASSAADLGVALA